MLFKTAFSLFLFSMGGHGALICALKNPGRYKTVSAFAPICNPILCPWGKKAFSGYFGTTEDSAWKEWDATELAKKYDGPLLNILIDQVIYFIFYKYLLKNILYILYLQSKL